MDGQLFANHRNGRDARATEVTFDSASGRRIFAWLSGMAKDGLAQATPKGAPDNLLAVANGISAMTLESSASLGTIVQVLGSGQFKDVQLGAAALPGPKAGAGTVMAGAALYLVNKSSPARQEAAWRFVKFLTDTKQMAEWAAGTGYVPIRKSSLDEKVLQDVYAKTPEFKVAYDQLQQGSETDANAGAVIGDFEGVRRAVVAAEQTLFSSRTPPADALKKAAVDADSAIKDYEERVAG
jgi:sn-glycerol 3-phosphate transport system substrate-binding protein